MFDLKLVSTFCISLYINLLFNSIYIFQLVKCCEIAQACSGNETVYIDFDLPEDADAEWLEDFMLYLCALNGIFNQPTCTYNSNMCVIRILYFNFQNVSKANTSNTYTVTAK